MYIRRKVFSLGEGNIDYDYNIYQQLYSEAFEDGVDYAIEKMFGSGDEPVKSSQGRGWGLLGTYGGGNAAYLTGRTAGRRAIRKDKTNKEVLRDATIASITAGAADNAIKHAVGAKAVTPLMLAHDVLGTAAGVHGARKNAKAEIKARS